MVRSGITISNQERLRRYNAERMQEEKNDVIQQAELYGHLAEENKLDAQAASLARLATNVFQKGFDNLTPEFKEPVADLLQSVKEGKLNLMVKNLASLPDVLLTARQRLIKTDLQNPEFLKTVNDVIADAVAEGKNSEEITKIVKDFLVGEEGKELDDMIEKIRLGEGEAKVEASKQTGKSKKRERKASKKANRMLRNAEANAKREERDTAMSDSSYAPTIDSSNLPSTDSRAAALFNKYNDLNERSITDKSFSVKKELRNFANVQFGLNLPKITKLNQPNYLYYNEIVDALPNPPIGNR